MGSLAMHVAMATDPSTTALRSPDCLLARVEILRTGSTAKTMKLAPNRFGLELCRTQRSMRSRGNPRGSRRTIQAQA